ncbi:UDP-N-acetylmuramate dehydrogenase [Algoriphagus boseongensis]|uniref:UDP-N-acetylenolpyruvoylglucosamine reductase n=1 Tax=Algoriphagus boseongensis TaxID=1442587 RepID=A0A4R6TAC1_9BACT|nr:UDP-N-acetylmuramate dehydrogenase [Algoriphagus boseongensis]TDQ19153.1 UDP-N-acetylmuramate dehydrogenase [Algoriphagus boseongensis]
MNIQENISLKSFNTFGIDQKARFFSSAKTLEDLKAALTWAKSQNLEVLVLGGGSNILLTKDFPGLVLKVELKGIQVVSESEEEILVQVGAGEIWHEWVMYSISKGWAGLENLSLIPGTVGASPMQNIGAYGVEIQEVFQSLQALERNSLEIHSFDSKACKFGYRESVFKHELKDRYIITSVTFKLNKTPKFHIEYGAIKETLAEKGIQELSIKAVSEAVIQIRESKLPDPKKIGNAGSFFKNPTIPIAQYEKLKIQFPEIPGYPNEEGIKVPAGWLIEKAGWKGVRLGDIGVHEKQALVLVNYGNGIGKEIMDLSEKIQKSILEKFGIALNPEVNFI